MTAMERVLRTGWVWLALLLAVVGGEPAKGETILAYQGQVGTYGDGWTGYFSDGNRLRSGVTTPLSGFGETNTAFLVSPLVDIDSHLVVTGQYRTKIVNRRTPEALAPVFAEFWIALIGEGDLQAGMAVYQAWNQGLRIWERDGVVDDWTRVYARTSAVTDPFRGRVVFGFRGNGETAGWVPGAEVEDAAIIHNPEPSTWVLIGGGVAVIGMMGAIRRRH